MKQKVITEKCEGELPRTSNNCKDQKYWTDNLLSETKEEITAIGYN